MSDRELDAKIHTNIFSFECSKEMLGLTKDDLFFVPYYSTDIAAAMQVEDRIEELGLIPEYCEALLNITDASEHFELIHASPEDRCRAAVMAAEAE